MKLAQTCLDNGGPFTLSAHAFAAQYQCFATEGLQHNVLASEHYQYF